MEFKTYTYIEVSTGFLPQSDHDLLLEPNAPHHMATHDEFSGAFFYTLHDVEPGTVEDFRKQARDFGLSDRFVEIMAEASRQNVQLVRFDSDGDMIEGLELIEEEENTLLCADSHSHTTTTVPGAQSLVPKTSPAKNTSRSGTCASTSPSPGR